MAARTPFPPPSTDRPIHVTDPLHLLHTLHHTPHTATKGDAVSGRGGGGRGVLRGGGPRVRLRALRGAERQQVCVKVEWLDLLCGDWD